MNDGFYKTVYSIQCPRVRVATINKNIYLHYAVTIVQVIPSLEQAIFKAFWRFDLTLWFSNKNINK